MDGAKDDCVWYMQVRVVSKSAGGGGGGGVFLVPGYQERAEAKTHTTRLGSFNIANPHHQRNKGRFYVDRTAGKEPVPFNGVLLCILSSSFGQVS